jgi:hypothetical protein
VDASTTASTVVWITPGPPDADHRRALASWASAHGARLVDAFEEAPKPLHVDLAAAGEVEARLEAARDAIAGLDAAAVDGQLAAAEALLRAHAELPEAGWLMAELERTRAIRFRRVAPIDAEAAERALRRAAAIDGGRAPGMGEDAAPPQAEAGTVELDFLPAPGDAVWLDGRPAEGRLELHAGVHVALVTRQGAPIWASWLDVLPGQSRLALDAPRPAPCSRGDVALPRTDAAAVDPGSTRCPRWIAVAPGPHPREILVATCEANRCEPPLSWRLPAPWAEPLPAPRTERRWPAWATWGAVGAGATIALTVVLAITLRSTPAEIRFVNGGIIKE